MLLALIVISRSCSSARLSMKRIFPACLDEINPFEAISESAKVVLPNHANMLATDLAPSTWGEKQEHTMINMSKNANVTKSIRILLQS
jgi:hypothetical protein